MPEGGGTLVGDPGPSCSQTYLQLKKRPVNRAYKKDCLVGGRGPASVLAAHWRGVPQAKIEIPGKKCQDLTRKSVLLTRSTVRSHGFVCQISLFPPDVAKSPMASLALAKF